LLRIEGPGGDANPRARSGWEKLLVDVEVENVGHLKVGAVVEHQIPADHDMHVIRGWWRKHDLYFARAGLHSATQTGRQSSIHDQLALQSGRQVIALGKPRRQMAVVVVIPATEVAVVIGIAEVIVAASVIFVAVGMTAPVLVVAIVTAAPIIIAVVFIVPMAVSLGYGHSGRERKGEHSGRTRS
jgi:hypothetical protein